jgi:hypothetical protein
LRVKAKRAVGQSAIGGESCRTQTSCQSIMSPEPRCKGVATLTWLLSVERTMSLPV